MSMPQQRVMETLINEGRMDDDYITTSPKHRHCKTCRRVVIAVYADTTRDGALGQRVSLDPMRLTPLGELQAHTAGIATWQIAGSEVFTRRVFHIQRYPASLTTRVHSHHQCGHVFDHYPAIKESGPANPPY